MAGRIVWHEDYDEAGDGNDTGLTTKTSIETTLMQRGKRLLNVVQALQTRLFHKWSSHMCFFEAPKYTLFTTNDLKVLADARSDIRSHLLF